MRVASCNVTRRLAVVLGWLGFSCAFVSPAIAGIDVYTNTDVGGFVEDSATPAFLDAVADWSTVHLTFETDSEGEPIPGNQFGECICEGDIFHALVDFRSPGAAEEDGISPERVLVFGLDPSLLTEPNEVSMGGAPQYRGPVEINFIGLGQGAANAFGLGNISFGADSTITLYDENDGEIGVYNGVAGGEFTFLGFVATDGEQIGRAVMQGTGDPNDMFLIQDFTFSPVPEPGATTLGVAALLTLMAISRQTPQRVESRPGRRVHISR